MKISRNRENVHTLRKSVESLRNYLAEQGSSQDKHALSAECADCSEKITKLLQDHKIPENYRIGIIGRFKAGKSSFVNEILETGLAGVDTTPETAAITTFKYGSAISAEISFIDSSEWYDLKNIYNNNNDEEEAFRVKKWRDIFDNAKQQIIESSNTVLFEPEDKIEKKYISDLGKTITLPLEKQDNKAALKLFRKEIKKYTNANSPYHCLVKEITITVPALILESGIELIDTPGLDDTERFRVSLTEQLVSEVDAVLFLTSSGAAYGQVEKDFILTLLRKNTLHRLMFIVTKVDQTYEQYLATCDEEEEEPSTIQARIDQERTRIEAEIEKTFKELVANNPELQERYTAQRNQLGLTFIASKNQQLHRRGKGVPYSLSNSDPGGIMGVKTQLDELLSKESRMRLIASDLASQTDREINNLVKNIEAKLAAVLHIKNKEEAERKLTRFRDELESSFTSFKTETESYVTDLQNNLENKTDNRILATELILSKTNEIIDAYQMKDIEKHWKTRRSGRWGGLYNLEERIANSIFPTLQKTLSSGCEEYSQLCNSIEGSLDSVSANGDKISRELELNDIFSLDLADELSQWFSEKLQETANNIEAEELSIISHLDTFISENMKSEISAARNAVATEIGTGTTIRQNRRINEFFTTLKQLIGAELKSHIQSRVELFDNLIISESNSLPNQALAKIKDRIRSAQGDLRLHAETAIENNKKQFEQKAVELITELRKNSVDVLAAIDDIQQSEFESDSRNSVLDDYSTNDAEPVNDTPEPWWVEVKNNARKLVDRVELKTNKSNILFETIFPPKHLIECQNIVIIDPYLAKHHQTRNLEEVITILSTAAKLKSVQVVTSNLWATELSSIARRNADWLEFEKDVFKSTGCAISVEIEANLHDRFVISDNGCMWNLGRGLDIFQPVRSQARANKRFRKIKQNCTINIFGPNI